MTNKNYKSEEKDYSSLKNLGALPVMWHVKLVFIIFSSICICLSGLHLFIYLILGHCWCTVVRGYGRWCACSDPVISGFTTTNLDTFDTSLLLRLCTTCHVPNYCYYWWTSSKRSGLRTKPLVLYCTRP